MLLIKMALRLGKSVYISSLSTNKGWSGHLFEFRHLKLNNYFQGQDQFFKEGEIVYQTKL